MVNNSRSSRAKGAISRCRRSSAGSKAARVRASSSSGAWAITRPSGPTAMLPPQKHSPSSKPTRLTSTTTAPINWAYDFARCRRFPRCGSRAVDAAGRRIRRADEHVHLFGLHYGRRRKVPEILANQHPHAAEPGRVEGLKTLAAGKIALLVEQPIGGQVDLAVQVDDPPALGIESRVEEAVLRRFLDEAGNQGHLARRLQKLLDLRRVGLAPLRHHVANESSRSATVRERRSGRPAAAGPPRSAPGARPGCGRGRPARGNLGQRRRGRRAGRSLLEGSMFAVIIAIAFPLRYVASLISIPNSRNCRCPPCPAPRHHVGCPLRLRKRDAVADAVQTGK